MQLFCTNEDSGHRVMLWYQQLPGHTALTLIGYGYGEMTNDSVEQPFKEHFRLTGDLTGNEEKNGSLSIFNLQALEHTATYFCAFSSPQHIKQHLRLTKTSSPPASDTGLRPHPSLTASVAPEALRGTPRHIYFH